MWKHAELKRLVQHHCLPTGNRQICWDVASRDTFKCRLGGRSPKRNLFEELFAFVSTPVKAPPHHTKEPNPQGHNCNIVGKPETNTMNHYKAHFTDKHLMHETASAGHKLPTSGHPPKPSSSHKTFPPPRATHCPMIFPGMLCVCF